MDAIDEVYEYFAARMIRLRPHSYLFEDLSDGDSSVGDLLAENIRLFDHLPNFSENFAEFARIRIGDVSSKTSYLNKLTEFFALEFAATKLNQSVSAVESQKMPVLAPNRRGNRSCDFRTGADEDSLYWEVKDYSAEEQRIERAKRAAPKTDVFVKVQLSSAEELRTWLIKMIRKHAIPKGANHLVVRVSNWSSDQRFSLSWANSHFPGAIEVNPGKFVVTADGASFPEFFRSVFWISSLGFAELCFQ